LEVTPGRSAGDRIPCEKLQLRRSWARWFCCPTGSRDRGLCWKAQGPTSHHPAWAHGQRRVDIDP